MSQYTREELVRKVENRESLERADLRGIDLEEANLEGISFILRIFERQTSGAQIQETPTCGLHRSYVPIFVEPTWREPHWWGQISRIPISQGRGCRADRENPFWTL